MTTELLAMAAVAMAVAGAVVAFGGGGGGGDKCMHVLRDVLATDS
eukprot:COSAG04_NODE_2089_length_4822_cov_39.655939_5_plen_45_part_00